MLDTVKLIVRRLHLDCIMTLVFVSQQENRCTLYGSKSHFEKMSSQEDDIAGDICVYV